jgi:hypothetical protein
VVSLNAIEQVTHYGDRLYRLRVRDRTSTEIDASRTGAVRLAAMLKMQRSMLRTFTIRCGGPTDYSFLSRRE